MQQKSQIIYPFFLVNQRDRALKGRAKPNLT